MQVRTPSLQHEVMIEAVENHMPQVIVIDEIGTELEAPGRPDDRRARRPADRHGPRQQPRQPDAQPDPVRPDRRDPERDPRRRGGAPAADPEERPRAQGAADVRRDHRDPGPRAGHGPRATSPTRSTRCSAATRSRRSCAGATRRASIAARRRPRPSPREQLGAERFAGLVGAGQPWRMEPGWRGDGAYRSGGYREAERGGPASGPATGRARAAAGARPAAAPAASRRPRGPYRRAAGPARSPVSGSPSPPARRAAARPA